MPLKGKLEGAEVLLGGAGFAGARAPPLGGGPSGGARRECRVDCPSDGLLEGEAAVENLESLKSPQQSPVRWGTDAPCGWRPLAGLRRMHKGRGKGPGSVGTGAAPTAKAARLADSTVIPWNMSFTSMDYTILDNLKNNYKYLGHWANANLRIIVRTELTAMKMLHRTPGRAVRSLH